MKRLFSFVVSTFLLVSAYAQEFETATQAVANMRLGWNLGNTLDSNSGDVANMWIEAYSSRTPSDYEKAWGQPLATRQLIHMFKEAGFNAIRVPVTWYPHYGTLNNSGKNWDQSRWSGYNVNVAWMKRVREVVDYVLDEGMYCILNVHHDTGNATTAWIRAEQSNYDKYSDRYARLWTAIANEFRDYDEHLLFEGYNEMTDKYQSWCFASFAAPGNYNAADAKEAYHVINLYAQCFVDAVRATGGNNKYRNLVVNTYAACCGAGTWNNHLQDPLKQMALPSDELGGHLAIQVHSYWDSNNYNSTMRSNITSMMTGLRTYLSRRLNVPVIIGEWGSDSNGLDYTNATHRKNLTDFAKYFVQKAQSQGFATFYWMGLSDGKDRSVPQWTQPEVVDALASGYYGPDGYVDAVAPVRASLRDDSPVYNLTGVRVNPNRPGLYIQGGRKFVVK